MSLNWSWKDKIGEVRYPNGTTNNLYRGNALFIEVWEDNNTYQLVNFACDVDHFKNMLGLTDLHRGENLYNTEFKPATYRLNTAYKSVAQIVQLFAKARTNVTIELYCEPNEYSDYKGEKKRL